MWADENPYAVSETFPAAIFAKCLGWNNNWAFYLTLHNATTIKKRTVFNFGALCKNYARLAE